MNESKTYGEAIGGRRPRTAPRHQCTFARSNPAIDFSKVTYGLTSDLTAHKLGSTLLQGTLDLLILRTLVFGSQHGQGIARAIQQQSQDVLLVDHGTLYSALQRLESKGWISAEWGTSPNNRRASFYEITRPGRQQLTRETNQWRKLAIAIGRILEPEM